MTHSLLDRRTFIKGSSALLALTAVEADAIDFSNADKLYRVALIGAGWYGKSDLFRLIQIAAVEVIALADPDRNMLAEAGQLVSERQNSGKLPQLYNEEGHISSASCILANLSMELGRPLVYDPQSMTVEGDEEATSLLS